MSTLEQIDALEERIKLSKMLRDERTDERQWTAAAAATAEHRQAYNDHITRLYAERYALIVRDYYSALANTAPA